MASSSCVINAIARNRLICESTLARLCIKAPWRGYATSAAAAVSALSDSSLRLRRQKLSDHIVQEIEPPRAREPVVCVMLHQTAGAQVLERRPQQSALEARALLAFCGLDWNPQTEAFVRYSTTHSGRARYYQVMKDTPEAMNRWRKELSLDDQHRILAVVRQTSLASYCPATDP